MSVEKIRSVVDIVLSNDFLFLQNCFLAADCKYGLEKFGIYLLPFCFQLR